MIFPAEIVYHWLLADFGMESLVSADTESIAAWQAPGIVVRASGIVPDKIAFPIELEKIVVRIVPRRKGLIVGDYEQMPVLKHRGVVPLHAPVVFPAVHDFAGHIHQPGDGFAARVKESIARERLVQIMNGHADAAVTLGFADIVLVCHDVPALIKRPGGLH